MDEIPGKLPQNVDYQHKVCEIVEDLRETDKKNGEICY
jgi:hypothetical protein